MDATIIGRVAVKVVPDTDEFRDDAQDALRKIERTLKSVDIKLEVAGASKKKVQAQLAALTRRRDTVIAPKMDKAAAAKVKASLAALSGARGFGNITRDFADWVGHLDEALPKIGAAGLAIGNLSSIVLQSSSNLLSLGSSIASIAGAALALPGILGGIALGAGATFAVLKDFNTVLPEVGKKFHDLQDSMSTRFWAKAEEPFRKFINKTFPEFETGMNRVSSGLGTFFAKFAASGSKILGGELVPMFKALRESIVEASEHTDAMVGIIHKLGSVGAAQLPRLAGWFGDITDKFDGWLGTKGPSGLQDFIDQGIDALKDLGGTITATSSLFAGLARAAETGGGSTLASLRSTMEGAARAVNSAKFQEALSNAFRGANTGLDELTRRTGPAFESFMIRLSDTLTAVLPRAGKTAGKALSAIFDALDQPKVQQTITEAFDKLDEAVTNLAPSLPGVASALASILDIAGDIGVNLSKALGGALEHLGPTISDLADDLKPLVDQLGKGLVNAVEIAGPIVDNLADALGGLAGVVTDILAPINGLIDIFQKMPGPIKEGMGFLASAGLLVAGGAWFGNAAKAKVLGLGDAILNAGTKSTIAQGAFLRTAVAVENVGTRMSGLRTGLAVGALALTGIVQSADKSNGALQAVSSIGGAALTGFFLGGPWGAAIGAGVGGLQALIEFAGKSGDAAEATKAHWEGLKDTLDSVTGATTEATRAYVDDQLVRSKILDDLAAEGVTRREAIDAVLGQKDALLEVQRVMANEGLVVDQATDKINQLKDARAALALVASPDSADYDSQAAAKVATIDDQIDALERFRDEHKHLIDTISEGIGATTKDTKAMRDRANAVIDYAERFRNSATRIPKKVITRFEQQGVPQSARGLANLQREYKLTPKQINTIIDVLGIDVSKRRVKSIRNELKDLGKTKPDLKGYVRAISDQTKQAQERAATGANNVKKAAEKPIKNTKADLSQFKKGVETGINSTKGTASSGGQEVGAALKAGIIAGFSGTAETLAAMAGSAVRAAVAAARTAGDINSPSRKMIEVGQFLGEGIVVGLAKTRGSAVKGARLTVEAVLKQSRKLKTMADRIKDLFKDLLKKAGPAADKQFRKMFGGRVDIADRYSDAIKKLQALSEKIKRLRAEQKAYEDQIRATVIESANPVALDSGTAYVDIVQGMKNAAAEAKAFMKVIKDLIKAGLNKTTLQQILAAGPEAGLAVAQSILQGGVDQINDIQAQINAAATGTADAAGQHFFGDLIGSAQGDVDKLLNKLKPLQAKLRKFAKDLIDALNDQLKKEFNKAGKDNGGGGKAGGGKKPKSASATNGRAVSDASTSGSGATNVLNYYAAPGSKQMTAEEQLFAAGQRGRKVFV